MVVAKGGGQGIRPQGLSKRTAVPTLLSFRGVPPPKKKPLPPGKVTSLGAGKVTLQTNVLPLSLPLSSC